MTKIFERCTISLYYHLGAGIQVLRRDPEGIDVGCSEHSKRVDVKALTFAKLFDRVLTYCVVGVAVAGPLCQQAGSTECDQKVAATYRFFGDLKPGSVATLVSYRGRTMEVQIAAAPAESGKIPVLLRGESGEFDQLRFLDPGHIDVSKSKVTYAPSPLARVKKALERVELRQRVTARSAASGTLYEDAVVQKINRSSDGTVESLECDYHGLTIKLTATRLDPESIKVRPGPDLPPRAR